MLPLSPDSTFNFELLRVLGAARYGAADAGEVLQAASEIAPGDFESWTTTFQALAEKVEASLGGGPAPASGVSIREVMFRAANYWRSADFFIHGDITDPRIQAFWANQTRCFDQATANLPIPAERFEVPIEGSTVLATFYRASTDDTARPTLLLVNGFDGGQEEMAHIMGFSALDRGINVVTFEGPGQPAVRREQGVGFIAEWEKVVTPLVDHVVGLPTVDPAKIGLLGNSYGGYLAPRAAAFEPRLAALLCIDGVYDANQGFLNNLPPELRTQVENGDAKSFNTAIAKVIETNTNLRWAAQQGMWAFKQDTPYDFWRFIQGQTLDGIAGQIKCPVFIGDATDDRFFEGQPEQLKAALGDRATLHVFDDKLSTQYHCQVGASVELNRAALDWFLSVVKLGAVIPREPSTTAE